MSGFVIGKTLRKGFAGNVSRSQDAVITCFAAKGEEIGFGDPVVINTDATVSKYVKGGNAAKIIGFAVRAAKQAKDDSGEAAYKAGEPVDVLLRGTICVQVVAGTPVPGGAVYVRTGTGEGHTAGSLVSYASTTTGETVKLANMVFASAADADGIAEVTVCSRAI